MEQLLSNQSFLETGVIFLSQKADYSCGAQILEETPVITRNHCMGCM